MQNAIGNYYDQDYDKFLARLQERFIDHIQDGAEPLFTTDAEGLFEAYLSAFPVADRQHHNCSACRHFINRYASLVTINAKGQTTPAILNGDEEGPYEVPLAAMAAIIRRSKVTGIFLSSDAVLGQPATGIWKHLAVLLPKSMLHIKVTLTARQKMAERREDFININRALAEFTLPMLEQALTLLKTDSLYRSEKVIGPAQWLHDLQVAKANSHHKANTVWRAIAVAPAGFCHPRASMIGTLLDDIASGMDFEQVSSRFKAKMHPLQYQRPQAAPAAGTIAQAEKIVAQLGAAGSLKRRFARVEEVEALWRPKEITPPKSTSVFGHLKTKDAPTPNEMRIPAQTMTWEKFSRTVLPDAEKIEFCARSNADNYTAFVTAVDPDAPPILQWDTLERRNPVSWYVWHGGSTPHSWGLQYGQFHEVSAVCLKPSSWYEAKTPHQGEAVVFLLADARETRMAGAAIFPETLKSEFHGIRSVIESYSKSAEIEGMAEGTACGIMLTKGHGWSHIFRVTVKDLSLDYQLDRWD